MKRQGLSKNERIVSRKLLETLFRGKVRSIATYPLRLVYMPMEAEEYVPHAEMLVSVSKRHFKRAVKRNRCKRHVREAYRLNKNIVFDSMSTKSTKNLAMAFIWTSDEQQSFAIVERSMVKLLHKMVENLA